jgi:transposase
MRKMKELLRLKALGLSQRQIARSLNLSVGVVNKYVRAYEQAGLTGEVVEQRTDAQCEEQLRLVVKESSSSITRFLCPDYGKMREELQRKGVTLKLLHEEYLATPKTHTQPAVCGEVSRPVDLLSLKKSFCNSFSDKAKVSNSLEENPPGIADTQSTPLQLYSYSQYCTLYRRWKKKQAITMKQRHEPGIAFIDYAGPKVTLKDSVTQATTDVPIFIMALGLSQCIYVEATYDQSLDNWIGSHVRAFEFFSGVPCLLVPDNTKTGVTQACFYDPDLNQTYAEMALHYGTVVMPTRPYKPRDKAKVENAVLVVERWILARLRHLSFSNLVELNCALKGLVRELNSKDFQKQPRNRWDKFQELDAPFLKPLPVKAYEVATFKKLKVAPDYHLVIDHHAYSVPHTFVGETVDIRITAHIIEVFHQGQRIASHERQTKSGTTTVKDHQLPSHIYHQDWTQETALSWAQGIGQSTKSFLAERFTHHHHRQQQYRYFLGMSKLARQFGSKRLEAVCKRALSYGITRYKQLRNLLDKGFDQVPLPKKSPEKPPISHENIRGATYYTNTNEKGNRP